MRARSSIVSVFALIAALGAARAQTSDADAEREKAEKAALEAAIALCDQRLSAPRDPLAVAPPVLSMELSHARFADREGFEKAVDACTRAAIADPDNARLRYQYLRGLYFNTDFRPPQEWVEKAIETFARQGHADAAYVSYLVHNRDSKDPARAAQALEFLRQAANAGHVEAIYDLASVLSGRQPNYPYAPREAVDWARRLAAGAPAMPAAGAPMVDQLRSEASFLAARVAIDEEGFSDEERAAGFAVIKAVYEGGGNFALWPYARALREGRGTAKDPAAARAVLQSAKDDKRAKVTFAEMLLTGEGGPIDRPGAFAILKDEGLARVRGRGRLLAEFYRAPPYPGPQPRAALAALQDDLGDPTAALNMAELMAQTKLASPKAAELAGALSQAAAGGKREAAIALAGLTFVGHGDFRDAAVTRRALAPFAARGDLEAKVMLAEAHFANLDGSSSRASFTRDQYDEAAARAVIEEGVAANLPRAVALHGRLQRKGLFYPQDDQAATRALAKAAGLGDVAAMVLVGKAYDDGLGIPKDKRERLRWWREAANRGSLEARESLASAFVFDSFDKLMTLREGVTEPIILWANGLGFRYGSGFGGMNDSSLASAFRGGRVSDAPASAIAAAALEGVRLAPAALEEQKLVALGRALPQEVKIEMERALAKAGYFKGAPQGYFGPDTRAALQAYAEKTPAAPGTKPEAAQPGAAKPDPSAAPQTALVPNEILDKARDRAFQMATNAKSDRDRAAALKLIAQLARYGDMSARWVLVRNYHQSRLVRAATSPAELTRYALDVLVTKPKGADKAEFEFIFDVTQMFRDRKIGAFARAFVDALRDDPRLRDPLTLGGVAQQVLMAPGGCDSLLAEARRLKLAPLDDDGCSQATQGALAAFAEKAGPAGVDAKARAGAAPEVTKIAAGGR